MLRNFAPSALLVFAICANACGPSRRPGPLWPEPLTPDAYSYYLQGQMAMREGNRAEAILYFRGAAQAAPDEAHIELALIAALRRAGRLEQARARADKARSRWPDDPDVWLVCGALYRDVAGASAPADKRAHARAIRAYARAVELAAGREDAHLGLAEAYLAAGRREDALSTYRSYLATAPNSIPALLAHAKALMDGRDHDRAVVPLRRVVAIDFKHVDGYRQLAHALRLAGHHDESLQVLRQAFTRSGESELGYRLVRQLAEAGLRTEALRTLDALAADEPDEDHLLTVATLYLDMGEWAAALALAERASARDPISGNAVLMRARALVIGQRSAEAIVELLAVPTTRAAFPECRALAARLLADARHFQPAYAALAEAAGEHPNHRALLSAEAYVHELDQQPSKARAVLGRAITRRPDDPDLLHALAHFQHRQGQWRDALATMERALELNPDDTVALGFIGRSLTERGTELERARRALERAVRLAPGDALLLGRYGWLRFKQGHYPDARRALERAALIFPYDAELLWRLGEVALVQRDRARGLSLLRRARALAPRQPLAARIEARLRALDARN